MHSTTDSFTRLTQFLSELPTPNAFSDSETQQISELLSDCWSDLDGSNEGGMEAYKLVGRLEQVRWSPPVLRFTIERHGARLLGSSRADLQDWVVNLECRTAGIYHVRHRELEPRDPPWRVKPVIEDVVKTIRRGKKSPGIEWLERRRRVRITLNEIVPFGGGQRTFAGRCKRFREGLVARLAEVGWVRDTNYVSRYIFVKDETTPHRPPKHRTQS